MLSANVMYTLHKKVDYNESVRIQTKAIHGFKKLL